MAASRMSGIFAHNNTYSCKVESEIGMSMKNVFTAWPLIRNTDVSCLQIKEGISFISNFLDYRNEVVHHHAKENTRCPRGNFAPREIVRIFPQCEPFNPGPEAVPA